MDKIRMSLCGEPGTNIPTTYDAYRNLVGEYRGLRIARNLIRRPDIEDEDGSDKRGPEGA
jgi:hypothetical protein